MPAYDRACPACGTFEHRATIEQAGDPVPCPDCGEVTLRIFAAPAARSARRMRQLTGLGADAVGRVDRSAAGQPTLGPHPAGGRRIGIGGASPGPPPPARAGRPWQLGH